MSGVQLTPGPVRPRMLERLLGPPDPGRADGAILAEAWTGRDYIIRRLLAAADLVAVILGLLVAFAASPVNRGWADLAWGLVTIPLWLVLFKAYKLYDGDVKRIQHGTLDEFPRLFHALLLGCLGLWGYSHLAPGGKLVFIDVLIFAGVVLVAVMTLRSLLRRVARRRLGPERVLFVGEGESIPVLLRKLATHPEYGLAPVGRLQTNGAANGDVQLEVLGDLEPGRLRRVAAAHGVERIIVPQDGIERGRLLQLLHEAKELSIKVSLLPHVFDAVGTGVEIDEVEGVTILGINPPVLSRSSRALKRTMDIVGASLALVVFSPMLLCAAIAIKLESRGAVLFRQQRVGKGGRSFRMLKLRTMVADAESRLDSLREQSTDPGWVKLDHDPRITRVGRFLRQTSIDELPQLWNVLRGEMSLVGPRPIIAAEDRGVDGWARSRLDLTPGITGLWQVLGRTNIPFAEMVKLDYVYVTNWSLWNDVRLILRTLPVVISRRGVN